MPVGITSYIAPVSESDAYAITIDKFQKGGCRTVKNIQEMFTISTLRRKPYMLVIVEKANANLPAFYWFACPYSDPTPSQLNDNQYWEKLPIGINLNGLLSLKGFIDATNTPFPLSDAVGNNQDTWIVNTPAIITDPNVFEGATVELLIGDYIVYFDSKWSKVGNGLLGTNWNTLAGKPDFFPPEAHTHTWSEIIDAPNLASYITTSLIVSVINSVDNGTKLANVDAIRGYVQSKINEINITPTNLSDYYNKSEIISLINEAATGIQRFYIDEIADFASITTQSLNDEAFVSNGKLLYRYEEQILTEVPVIAWYLKYSVKPSIAEVKQLYEANANTNALTDARASKLDAQLALTNNAAVVAAVDASLGNTLWKERNKIIYIHAISTVNIESISGAIEIDNYGVGTGEIVALIAQNVDNERGLYIVNTGGAWSKIDTDYNNLLFFTDNGTSNKNKIYRQVTLNDNTALSFTLLEPDDIVNISKVDGNLVITKKNKSSYNLTFSNINDSTTSTTESWSSSKIQELIDEISVSGGHIIKDEGVNRPNRANLNFLGDGVSATDNEGANSTDITITKDSGSEIKTKLFAELDTNNLTDILLTKLNNIANGAEVNLTASEIKTVLFALADTNNFTDAYKNKLDILVTNYKGWYIDETSLTTAYPTATEGDWAIVRKVGAVDTVWTWDIDGSPSWVDTGASAPSISVINDLVTGGTTAALSAEQGKILKGLIDDLVINPIIQAATTFAVTGIKLLDLDTFDYDEGITLNANITFLLLSNGTQGRTYTIKFIQGVTGGTLTLAPNWTGSEGYVVGAKVIFVDSGYYNVYRCTTDHTSHATDYTLDLSNWTLNYRVESGNQIILSTQETQVDFLDIFVEGTNLYRITPSYD